MSWQRPVILLVDDDPAVRASVAFALEVEGFDVRAFAGGEALPERLGEIEPACILLDHRLPGIDAVALLQSLRARFILAPAIVIASNPPRGLRQRVEEAGARLVEKPLLCDALVGAIRDAVAPSMEPRR